MKPSPAPHRRPLAFWLLVVAAALSASLAWAEGGFRVARAISQVREGVVLLDARIDYDFSKATLDALHNGVPLTVEIEIEILRSRDWAWDETVAALTQRYRLEYHALARQYVVVNLNSGEFRSFPTRAAALVYMGELNDFPVLDAALLDGRSGGSVYGRIRAGLDIEALPPPLRPVAYLSSAWRLGSPWLVWSL